jgi:hypothetical protein
MTSHISSDDYDKYIVKIVKREPLQNKWIPLEDGYAIIKTETYGPVLRLMSHENIHDIDNFVYFEKIINENLYCEFIEGTDEYKVKVGFSKDNYRYGIKFDGKSSSAFNHFKKNIEDKTAMCTDAIYYSSGNLWMTGTFLNDRCEGNGVQFYDDVNTPIKYRGEFEKNMYDGAGIFYSKNGMIEISINNISKGIPNGMCQITVHRHIGKPLKRTFKYDNIKLNIDTYDENFCTKLAYYLIPNLDTILFNSTTVDEKVNVLNNKIDYVLTKINNIETKFKMNKIDSLFYQTIDIALKTCIFLCLLCVLYRME